MFLKLSALELNGILNDDTVNPKNTIQINNINRFMVSKDYFRVNLSPTPTTSDVVFRRLTFFISIL